MQNVWEYIFILDNKEQKHWGENEHDQLLCTCLYVHTYFIWICTLPPLTVPHFKYCLCCFQFYKVRKKGLLGTFVRFVSGFDVGGVSTTSLLLPHQMTSSLSRWGPAGRNAQQWSFSDKCDPAESALVHSFASRPNCKHTGWKYFQTFWLTLNS